MWIGMSYFYLQPIVGNVQLHVLKDCVCRRFDHLQKLYNGEPTSFCEYVIEGSVFDNIGHFVLGSLIRASNEKSLLDVVNRAEEKLFIKRLNTATINDIRLLCKTILKNLKNINLHIPALSKVCRPLLIKHIAEHVFGKDHKVSCNNYNIYVNFLHCLPFISGRLVEIKKGQACIPCGLWKRFMIILFNMNLHCKFENLSSNIDLKFDPRWQEILITIINSSFVSSIQRKLTLLKHNDVDNEIVLFPLCMKNLHNVLRTNHRLSHDDRFRYSLFLKDVGLSLPEAIHFWQKEYSKPCIQSSCSHTWHKDEKKYVYSLRHLYGLEGGRKNYHMSTCSTIQKRSCSSGCAFKHFDDDYLKKVVHTKILTRNNWNVMNLKRKSGLYSEACLYYRNIILTNLSQDFVNSPTINMIFSPVEYYLDSKQLLQL